tara:strand:- start:263 stop:613 length:351 start_codon:yes stop_codon:yes gene_type:complete
MSRLIDLKHLAMVRGLPCMISRADYYSHSTGRSQAHHLLKPNIDKFSNKGFNIKSNDSEVIPLCVYHHMILHSKFGSEKEFFKNYGMKETSGQEYAKQLYEGNPNWIDDSEDDLPF